MKVETLKARQHNLHLVAEGFCLRLERNCTSEGD